MRYIECDWCGQRNSVASTHVPATLALAVTGLVRGPDDTVALDVCGTECASQAVRAMRRGMSAERESLQRPPAVVSDVAASVATDDDASVDGG